MALNSSVRGGGPSAEFFAWLGDTLTANYGRRFAEYGFDSIEVLRELTREQVDRMLTEFVLIDKPGHRFLFLNKLDDLRGGREELTTARAIAAAPPQQLTRSAVAPSALRRAPAVLDVNDDGATALSSALSSFSQRPRIQRPDPVVEAPPSNMIRRIGSISNTSNLFDPMSDPLVVVRHPIDPMDEPDRDFYHGHQRVVRSGSTIDEAGIGASAPHDDDPALGKSAPRGAVKRPKSNKAIAVLRKPTSPTHTTSKVLPVKSPSAPTAVKRATTPSRAAPTPAAAVKQPAARGLVHSPPMSVVAPPNAGHDALATSAQLLTSFERESQPSAAYDTLIAMLHSAPALQAAKAADAHTKRRSPVSLFPTVQSADDGYSPVSQASPSRSLYFR
jgi:hypothetical protein